MRLETVLPKAPLQMTAPTHDEARRILEACPFVRDLGLELESLGEGTCTTVLDLKERHLQQDGFVHAGVQATVADHTAGTAGATLIPAGRAVLSIEFKINLLRPARGERLVCRAKVLRAGKSVSVVESEVHSIDGGVERLVSKATVTLAIVPRPEKERKKQA
jgi:uncharacterized protein (TIGR00369 family)